MQVVVLNGDISGAMRVLKKKLETDRLKIELKLRSIPKPSERRREKERAAGLRLKKRQRGAVK